MELVVVKLLNVFLAVFDRIGGYGLNMWLIYLLKRGVSLNMRLIYLLKRRVQVLFNYACIAWFLYF